MIKVKIQNPSIGRNRPTFDPLYVVKDMLRDYSIDITESDDYDYLFVGMNDFLNKKLPLKESIEFGLENLSKITGDYFLFDGSDSTSLMGAYEVFEQSNAIYLMKNQLLPNRADYKTPYAFNKFFFGTGSELDLSYDIPIDVWSRIKFSHNNLGYWNNYHHMQPVNTNKTIDVCAIFSAHHTENYDHEVRNDLLYTEHRSGLWNKLQPLKDKYSIITEKLPYQEYVQQLWKSKVCLSPYGMGEFCFRDLEAMVYGTLIIKPSHKLVDTLPNLMIDDETFIPCKYDWSDLEEKLDYVYSNFNELNQKITYNIRKKYSEEFTSEKLCMYYYNIFNGLDTILKE
tara:strand:+ start:4873 stop:5895 length:1023 start_codon:yes stop_codon:yes gene_type:complete